VFRAHDPAAERLVAIKVFRLDVSPEQAAALVRELEHVIARGIAHRGVAAPIAAGIDGDATYLAMEYVVGDSLDVTAGVGGPMPMSEVVRIVDGIAAAIDACAARGVHHGLLHPRDVILGADGPRVTAFGIAEALSRIGLRLPVRRPYAAPEGASDVYSLAAMAYELISGRRMTPTGWDELSAEDGPELRDAFAAALSPDPQRRFATAGEFAAKLRAGGRAGASPAPPAPVMAPIVTMAEPDPAFDADALDRFADAGAASDLHLDFVPPPEVETPFPPSWSAQPPRALQAEESEPARGGTGRMIVLVLIALAVAAVAAYLVSGRTSTPTPAAKTTPAKPPVTATTVDLPPSPAPVPPGPALPAPTPSRPASGAASAPPIRPAAAGRLLIRTTPADAVVTINGEPRGKTPLAVRDLALGLYTIHVSRNGFAAADRRVRLTARRPSESLEISLKAVAPAISSRGSRGSRGASEAGRLSVESRPSGARVFVNDRLVGATPLAMPGLPAGPATVRIEMDGYQTWATTVRVNAGEQTRVAASLDRK
jgi:serine/threonine protein kinase